MRRNYFLLIILFLALSLGSCGLFKPKCTCPSFGQYMPANRHHSARMVYVHAPAEAGVMTTGSRN